MEPNNELIVDVWDLVKGYCLSKKRDELAYRILHIFKDYGADTTQFGLLIGEDFNLDNAVNRWIEEYSADDKNIEEEFDEYYVEDDEG